MSLLATLTLREKHLLDCDEVFNVLENTKRLFMIGLTTMSLQIGDMGDYIFRTECLWACSCFQIDPPPDLLKFSDAKCIDKDALEDIRTIGFYSDDPIDLINSLIDIPSSLLEKPNEVYIPPTDNNEEYTDAEAGIKNIQSFDTRLDDKALSLDVSASVPIHSKLGKIATLVPLADLIVVAAMLGRPDGLLDMTTHRLCQVIYLWRRTSIAMATASFDAPSSEYSRIHDMIAFHNSTASEKKLSNGNINCISPFEALSTTIDWITSIVGLPMSVLQAICMISKGGSCDPWLEDPKQSCRGSHLIVFSKLITTILTR